MAHQEQGLAHENDAELKVPAIFQFWQGLTYTGILLVAGFAAQSNNFSEMWVRPTNPSDEPLFIARIILFVVLVVWAIRWVYATHEELEMWVRGLEYVQKPIEAYGAMGVLSVFLGLVVAFPHRILFVTGLFTASLLVNYWTQSICNQTLFRSLQSSRRQYSRIRWRMRVLDVMEHYWIDLPQLARITTMMFISSVAFSLALAGKVQAEPQKSHFYFWAYTILILDIVGAEILVGIWRYELAKIKEPLESKGKLMNKLEGHRWIKNAH